MAVSGDRLSVSPDEYATLAEGAGHEPTEASKGNLMPEWQHIHDNAFMHPGVAESRLGNRIREG